MTVTGLGGDFYYIDNKIIVKIKHSGTTLIKSVSLSIVNYANGKTANLPLLYPNPNAGGELVLDLSRIIKGLFTLPTYDDDYTTNNIIIPTGLNNMTITFTARLVDDTIETSTFTKNFIRGGNFNYKDNQQAIQNDILSPTYYLPHWADYPFSYNKIDRDGNYVKLNPFVGVGEATERLVLLPVKSCNGAYFRFLNSKGGFSYWLFDGYNDTIDINHFGDVDNLYRKIDLGSRSSITIQVSGKVSDDYFPLMRDLITSPYIHLWKNEEWIQVYSDGNNRWIDQSAKRAHKVSYRFNFFNQNNRSLLW